MPWQTEDGRRSAVCHKRYGWTFSTFFYFSFLVVVVNSSGIFALEKEKQTQLQHKFIEIARIVSFG